MARQAQTGRMINDGRSHVHGFAPARNVQRGAEVFITLKPGPPRTAARLMSVIGMKNALCHKKSGKP
jgi:hypothetical protein